MPVAFLLLFLILLIWSCEPWNETSEVSHVSSLPGFEIIGDAFESYIVGEADEYNDKGALAFEGKYPLEVYTVGEADLSEAGVYTIAYYAQNSDGLWSTAERIVAVAYTDISNNNLAGRYEGRNFDIKFEMVVTKIHEKGLYGSNDIMGFEGAEMQGQFVDLGNHELVLIHGEGDFGAFADADGEYTLSSLKWTVKLIDAPYNGLELPIYWSRAIN